MPRLSVIPAQLSAQLNDIGDYRELSLPVNDATTFFATCVASGENVPAAEHAFGVKHRQIRPPALTANCLHRCAA